MYVLCTVVYDIETREGTESLYVTLFYRRNGRKW